MVAISNRAEEHSVTHAALREEVHLCLSLGPEMEVLRLHRQLSCPRTNTGLLGQPAAQGPGASLPRVPAWIARILCGGLRLLC